MIFAQELLDSIRKARHIDVFTGAGVSAESGIPTFRDAMTGLWSRFDPGMLASPEGFEADPALVWGWYEWRRMRVMQAEPNPAHYAISALARRSSRVTVTTQNVDDLHERGGFADPIRLHGSILQARCVRCATPYHFPTGIPDEPEGGRRLSPPTCAQCGSWVRPGVVWFGEQLPQAAWKQAESHATACDVLMSIGTSSMVWPAAALPNMASQNGAVVVQINPVETSLDAAANFNLRGKAGEVLPALIDALG